MMKKKKMPPPPSFLARQQQELRYLKMPAHEQPAEKKKFEIQFFRLLAATSSCFICVDVRTCWCC
jgi:hypothetical protein